MSRLRAGAAADRVRLRADPGGEPETHAAPVRRRLYGPLRAAGGGNPDGRGIAPRRLHDRQARGGVPAFRRNEGEGEHWTRAARWVIRRPTMPGTGRGTWKRAAAASTT